MGNHGRFGKYGEKKRIERLRKARSARLDMPGKGMRSKGSTASFEKWTGQKSRVIIRQAAPSDANFLRALSKEVFQHYGPYENLLPSWFEMGATITFISLKGRKPVGFAMLSLPGQNRFFPRICELLAIAVEPSRQRLGIGDLLMEAVEQKTSELEIDKLVLHTGTKNLPAQRLFRKYGFAPLEIKEDFYSGGQDALMMFRDFCNSGQGLTVQGSKLESDEP